MKELRPLARERSRRKAFETAFMRIRVRRSDGKRVSREASRQGREGGEASRERRTFFCRWVLEVDVDRGGEL